MTPLRGAVVGAGYFSRFHLEGWSRVPGVSIVGVCDRDLGLAAGAASAFPEARGFDDAAAMLDALRPDFLDVVTPSASHAELCAAAADRGVHVICQKPFTDSLETARRVVQDALDRGVRVMVHENFRFQPWHRETRRLIESGAIGSRLHSLTFRSRPGDGWGPDAYRARQPYFRTMPRLLVRETGIHFIDTFRFLGGEVHRVFALLRRLNPVIAGEDCGLLVFEFTSGAVGVWDANRYNESNAADPRYTFGEFQVEGDGGSLRLDHDGGLFLKSLGGPERPHDYFHDRQGFGGDCVRATQLHFAERLRDGLPFETDAAVYLKNLAIENAIYESSRLGVPVEVRDARLPSRGPT